jgi:hypothetical protein
MVVVRNICPVLRSATISMSVSPQNSYAKVLTPKMMVLGDGALIEVNEIPAHLRDLVHGKFLALSTM